MIHNTAALQVVLIIISEALLQNGKHWIDPHRTVRVYVPPGQTLVATCLLTLSTSDIDINLRDRITRTIYSPIIVGITHWRSFIYSLFIMQQ